MSDARPKLDLFANQRQQLSTCSRGQLEDEVIKLTFELARWAAIGASVDSIYCAAQDILCGQDSQEKASDISRTCRDLLNEYFRGE